MSEKSDEIFYRWQKICPTKIYARQKIISKIKIINKPKNRLITQQKMKQIADIFDDSLQLITSLKLKSSVFKKMFSVALTDFRC